MMKGDYEEFSIIYFLSITLTHALYLYLLHSTYMHANIETNYN